MGLVAVRWGRGMILALFAVAVSWVVAAPASAWTHPDPLPYREVSVPVGGDPVGAIMVIHGGAWNGGRERAVAVRSQAQRFVDQGWLVWNVDYRSGDDSIGDVLMWYRMLVAEFSGPICAWGESAGGHLALMLAALEHVNCVLSEGGPTDLTRMNPTLDQSPVPADRWQNSPLRYAIDQPEVFAETEMLLGSAENDLVIPVAPVREFAAALSDDTELQVMRDGTATFIHRNVDPAELEVHRHAERRLLARVAGASAEDTVGSVGVENGTLTVRGAAHAASNLVVTKTARGFDVTDPAGLQALDQCAEVTITRISCETTVGTASILAGDLNDRARITGGVATTIAGEDGDDTLIGGPGSDRLDGGAGKDSLDGGAGPDQMIGGAGTDVADYQSRSSALTLTLDSKANDGAAGEGDTLANDLEWVVGGSGNDKIVGSAAGEALMGQGGNDTIDGGLGADWIRGGAGTDVADYQSRSSALTLTLDSKANDGAAGEGDTLANDLEWVVGGSGNDKIVGSAAGEALMGQGGNDTIDGGLGADWIRGGAGTDVADYQSRSSALTLTLDSKANDGAAGEGDTLANDLEWVVGGSGNDKIVGSAAGEALMGQGGNDTIDGGLGADWIRGGAGKDSADYQIRVEPLTLTLDGKSGNDGAVGEGDTLADDLEWVIGGAGNDVLRGGPVADTLDGGAGDDDLDGLGGRDEVNGGPGADVVRSRDLLIDAIGCGGDEDSVVGDLLDSLLSDCELLDLI